MIPSLDDSDLALAGFILIVVLGPIASLALLRKFVFGIARPPDRFKLPWRFSLRAIGGLTTVTAGVFALFRDLPCTAAVLGGLTLLCWTSFARFGEFRHVLEERTRKALAAALTSRRKPPGSSESKTPDPAAHDQSV